MTKEDNIIVPRWFLVVVKNTLRIQNNINLNEKTGETCQDRNLRQSLNGICKLLKGEELTGMERLEMLQPSIPSNLDDAAFKYENELWESGYKNCGYSPQEVNDAFKAGAEWLAGQGVSEEYDTDENGMILLDSDMLGLNITACTPSELHCKDGDLIVIQIRKKQ